MAQKERSAEEFNPKHRILGAAIVVAVAVIVVPMLLRQHEAPTELKGAETPHGADGTASPNKVVVTPVTPTARSGRPAADVPAPVKEPAPAETPAKAAPVKPDAPAAKAATAEPPAKEKPLAKAPPAAKLDKGWVLQVGTFASADNANRLSDKLRQHGHTVLTEKISLDGRSAVRLRVGPFADKSAALKAQARIEREQGVKGVVLAYP